MQLSKLGRAIVGAVVVLFLLAIAGLVVMTATRDEPEIPGSLELTLNKIDEEVGLEATAVSPADIYGKDWVAATVVCPGTTKDELEQQYQIDPTLFDLQKDEVPEHDNYMVVRKQGGDAFAEKLSRGKVDLCGQQVPGYFDSMSILPMVKSEDGQWVLAG